jgi:hypothetical protein
MKILARLLLLAALLCGVGHSAFAMEKKAPAPTPAATPGVEAARTLSTLTGVAISPLLGVGAVGAHEWYVARQAGKPAEHWYAQPHFWIPALLLVVLVALKDILGTAAPAALKKPFDVAEAVENKISGMVAAGTFVPFMVTIFPKAANDMAAALHQAGFATISAGDVANWLMVPFAIALFLVVWLASHAINILILLSPFTTVDMALKSFRVSILGLVCLTAWINPWLGACFSLIVVFVAWLIAGWAFRLLVVGWVYSWDLFTLRRHRFLPAANRNWIFAARTLGDVPIRTYGKLIYDSAGRLTFEYRPWLVLPKKTLPLPEAGYAVGRGLLYPEVMRTDGGETKTLLILPPRYKGHESDLARAYGIPEVRDVGILKGIKAIGRALKSLFGFAWRKETVPAPA